MSASSGYGAGGSGPVGPVVETLTGNVGGAVGPTANNINIIGSGTVLVTGNPGTSTLTITNSGAVTDEYDTDSGTAIPVAGVLNILGGASTAGTNIHTTGSGNTVDIILNDSILLPNTNGSGTEGVIFLGGNTFMHNFGTATSTFLGSLAGNLTNTGTENTGIGSGALGEISSGEANTAVGKDALQIFDVGLNTTAIGDGVFEVLSGAVTCNTALGCLAGANLVDGSYNLLLGAGDASTLRAAGYNYTSNESHNCIIYNPGVALDVNTLRVGTDGSGTGEQNKAYIAGIYNRSFGATSGVVQIDNTFKLGSSNGTDGQLLIGGGTGPVWANLTSTGGTVTITNLANGINLEAVGGGSGGAVTFPADVGVATEAAGVINIFGGSNINTFASGHTVVVNLNEFISLPNTNMAADEGVIYLGVNTFMHNYGTQNTFLGQAAGNQTLTVIIAENNVGIGTNVLQDLTTGQGNSSLGVDSMQKVTSSPFNSSFGLNSLKTLTSGSGFNCAYGVNSLEFLLTGSNNVAIGYGAGDNYTGSEASNILIGFGVSGTNGENNTIRIGVEGEQNKTYIAGIYGESVGATNAPVFIDNNGKLGTVGGSTPSSAQAFFAVQSADLPSFDTIWGTPNYNLGSLVTMSKLYDDGGNVYVGSGAGAPATFTAPVTGIYVLSMSILVNSTNSIRFQNTIVTTSTSYLDIPLANFVNSGGVTYSIQSHITTVQAAMTAGDTATFNTYGSGINFSGLSLLAGTSSAPYTWISGYLIQ